VKSDIAWGTKEKGDTERLDGPIQVHVKDGILIVPATAIGCYLVTDEEFSIVSLVWLDLDHCCTRICPNLDSRLHSHGVTGLVKYEVRRPAADRKLLVGEIVKHVALIWMRLAPGEFMRADVGGFAIIGRTWVIARNQVACFHQDPVRHAVVHVAAVVVGVRWERAGERIDPRP